MKNKLSIVLTITLSLAFIDSHALKIMSYNIRRMGDDPVEHQWNNRKQLVLKEINTQSPDIIGAQEVVVGQQFEDLKSELTGYASFGQGRKEKSWNPLQWMVMLHPKAKNEANPILYKADKFELIKSETIDINPGGRFFVGSWLPRVFTAGIFKDKATNKNFCIINTHLDKDSSSIRNKQVKMILNYVTKKAKNLPVAIMGDFNTPIEGEIKEIFAKEGFVFAKDATKKTEGPQETRTGWNNEQFKNIDHIMVKKMDVERYAVIKNKEGKYPSDHRPVIAEISLN